MLRAFRSNVRKPADGAVVFRRPDSIAKTTPYTGPKNYPGFSAGPCILEENYKAMADVPKEEEAEAEEKWQGCTIPVMPKDGPRGEQVISHDEKLLVEVQERVDRNGYKQSKQNAPGEDDNEKAPGNEDEKAPEADESEKAPTKKKKRKAYARKSEPKKDTVTNLREGKAAYVGYSMHMDGPVFATPGSGEKALEEFNFKGLNLKAEPSKTIVGGATIPHYSLSSKFNVKILKTILHGKDLESVYESPIGVRKYKEVIEKLIDKFTSGDVLSGLSHERVRTWPTEPGTPWMNDMFPNLTPGKRDRLLADITSNIGIMPGVFLFKAAYINALDHPEEIDERLREFALHFPYDILPLPMLRLALHLWADIVNSEDLLLEEFEKVKGSRCRPVPHVSLAEFLIYFSHWLRWTDEMGLIAYPHPFRFTEAAVASDHSKYRITVDESTIDENRMLTLLTQVKSKIPSITPNHRMLIYPCMLEGANCPIIYNLAQYQYPTKIQRMLVGLSNIHYYGLDSYKRPSKPQNHDRRLTEMSGKHKEIFLPKIWDDGLFKPMGTLVETEIPEYFFWNRYFEPFLKPSPVVKREGPLAPTQFAFPPKWDICLEDILPAHTLDILHEKARYHYDRLERLGHVAVLGDSELMVDRDLNWMPTNMKRMAPEDLEQRPRKVIRGPDAPRSPSPTLSTDGFVQFEEEEPAPVPDYPEYEEIAQALSAAPDTVHWAWKEGLEDVKALEEGNRPEAKLKELVTKAAVAAKDDWRTIRKKVEKVLKDGEALTKAEVDAELPLAFGRLLGIRPPEGPYPEEIGLWNHFRKPARAVDLAVATHIGDILDYCGKPSANDKGDVEDSLKEFENFVRPSISAEWLGKWKDFIEEDLYSED
ncbi:hypothetical protein V8C35DRAFT_333784 [Trichoderma chlorosporum]